MNTLEDNKVKILAGKKIFGLFGLLIVFLGIGYLLFSHLTFTNQSFGTHWEETKHIYVFEGAYVGQRDLAISLEIDTSKQLFFNYIAENHQAFIMNSRNIFMLDIGRYPYFDMTQAPPMYLSPLGYRVDISLNFLELNPISTVNNIPIEEQIVWDSSVLNILVPEHLMPYENEIKQLYLLDFYFQKITVENFYNEELNLPFNNTSIEELNINIIYVNSGQYYFLFDPDLRSETGGLILDPIAVIYTSNVHPSNLGTWFMNRGVYFKNPTMMDNDTHESLSLAVTRYGLRDAIPSFFSIRGE